MGQKLKLSCKNQAPHYFSYHNKMAGYLVTSLTNLWSYLGGIEDGVSDSLVPFR